MTNNTLLKLNKHLEDNYLKKEPYSRKMLIIAIISFILLSLSIFVPRAEARIVADLIAEEISLDLPTPQKRTIFQKLKNIFSDESPRKNILVYKFDHRVTYPIRLKKGVATIINLPEDEKITFIKTGGNELFDIAFKKDIPNLITIDTLFDNAQANLVVKTNLGSIYNFYLTSSTKEESPSFSVHVIRNDEDRSYVRKKLLLSVLKKNNSYLKKVKSLDRLNTSYKIKGDKQIAPIFVYDDGSWTYFDFGKSFVSNRLPNVYRIVDEFDSTLNTRIKGNLIIAQSLSPDGWTLKNGDKTVCIYPKKNLYEVYQDERFR